MRQSNHPVHDTILWMVRRRRFPPRLAALALALGVLRCSFALEDVRDAGPVGGANSAGGGQGGGAGTGASAGTGGSQGGTSGGTCSGCDVDQCCSAASECVDGTADVQCGTTGAACQNCVASNLRCGRAGPSVSDAARTCLPPCAGHLELVPITSGDLGGSVGADQLCQQAHGQAWHLATGFDGTVRAAHGGSDIAGLCAGNWCTDVPWGTVTRVLSSASCDELTSSSSSVAEALYYDPGGTPGNECYLGGGPDDCAGWPETVAILCTDT
jgi:hypothetical protein